MKRSILIILLGALIVIGCSSQPPSDGPWNNIVIFAQDEDWDLIADDLNEIYEKEIKTPQNEKIFTVFHVPLENFTLYKKRRFVVIAATLETGGRMGVFLRNTLSPEILETVKSGTYLIMHENEWAKDQIVTFLIAPDMNALRETVKENSDKLFRNFDSARNNYVKAYMYEEKEQVDIAIRIFDDNDFTFRIQRDYHVALEDSAGKVIWIRRWEPDRMIFVHWIDTTDVDAINGEWVVEKRNNLGREYIDNTVILDKYSTVRQGSFNDYFAVEVRGIWVKLDSVTNDPVVGGPLVNYTFFDDITSRIYMIDLMVFAPDFIGEKEPLIRQLEIFASTFTTSRPGKR